jgi:hypothetical protein
MATRRDEASMEDSSLGQLPLFPSGIRAKRMGELRRGNATWDVFVECERDAVDGVTRGRVHFSSGARVLTTAWIFLEWTERDVEMRFYEFSAQELWAFLGSVTP